MYSVLASHMYHYGKKRTSNAISSSRSSSSKYGPLGGVLASHMTLYVSESNRHTRNAFSSSRNSSSGGQCVVASHMYHRGI